MTLSPLRGAIVAMNEDRVIGVDGDLPWHYPADLKRFKQRTMGTTIVMGRLTWESIGCKTLPGRRNIVLTRSTIDGIETMTGIDAVLRACPSEDVWFIGGGQIYRAAMDVLNLLDVTWVPDKVATATAVRFPEIDPHQWREVERTPLEGNPALVNAIYHRRA